MILTELGRSPLISGRLLILFSIVQAIQQACISDLVISFYFELLLTILRDGMDPGGRRWTGQRTLKPMGVTEECAAPKLSWPSLMLILLFPVSFSCTTVTGRGGSLLDGRESRSRGHALER